MQTGRAGAAPLVFEMKSKGASPLPWVTQLVRDPGNLIVPSCLSTAYWFIRWQVFLSTFKGKMDKDVNISYIKN